MSKLRIGISGKIYPRPQFERIVKQKMSHSKRQRVMLAYRLAKYGHRPEERLDHTRYFDHCKGVALIIMLELRIFLSYAVIVGLLHDIEENTFLLKWHDIEHIFGEKIYLAIRDLTKEEGKDYFTNLKFADWWVIVVKLTDRLHNLRTIVKLTESHKKRQLKETREKILPLIDILKKENTKRIQSRT